MKVTLPIGQFSFLCQYCQHCCEVSKNLQINDEAHLGAASRARLSQGWLEDGGWRKRQGSHRGLLHLDQERRRQQGALQKGKNQLNLCWKNFSNKKVSISPIAFRVVLGKSSYFRNKIYKVSIHSSCMLRFPPILAGLSGETETL